MRPCGRIISCNRAKEEIMPKIWDGGCGFEKQMSLSVFTEGVKVPERLHDIYNLHLKTPLNPYLGKSVSVRLVHEGHNWRYFVTLRYSATQSGGFNMRTGCSQRLSCAFGWMTGEHSSASISSIGRHHSPIIVVSDTRRACARGSKDGRDQRDGRDVR